MFRLLYDERVNREKKLESKLPLNIKLNRLLVALYITKDIITLEVMLLTNPCKLFVNSRPNHRQPREKTREKPLESTGEKGRLRAAQRTKATLASPSGYLGNRKGTQS